MERVNFFEGGLENGVPASLVGDIGPDFGRDDYVGEIVELSVFLFIHSCNNKFMMYIGNGDQRFFSLTMI